MTDRYFATVPTGLQFIAAAELAERFAGCHVTARRGKVRFDLDAEPGEPASLRSIDHLFAFVAEVEDISFEPSGLDQIRNIAEQVDFDPALALWRRVHPDAGDSPSFRVTADRAGPHIYQSPDVAKAFGAGMVRRFGWPVRMHGYDLEVQLYLTDARLTIGLCLTASSIAHERRLVRGRAATKPNIAYAMARLARIQPGDLVADPMCGVGSIPIEAAAIWPDARYLAGDIDADELAIAREAFAMADLRAPLLRWDARRLPLPDDCLDVILCDLPFGRRVGSHRANKHLYPHLLPELARVLKPGGRAVLLTVERRIIERSVNRDPRWRWRASHPINLGGLEPVIYELWRA